VTALVLSLTGAALVLAVLAWVPKSSGSNLEIVISGVMLACLAAVGVLLLAGHGVSGWAERWWNILLLLAGALAVTGGGPLTTSVMALADRRSTRAQSTQKAGEVLRGGALIGALERMAIYASLVAGWPEGIAVVLAIKGLARYPELRSPDQPASVTPQAVAERFIIGTFSSVLWAVACAGLLRSH
jgi:F0F1-type ATP synthase membrane subunit c/vacuolar-type H+-ATPase subunit K